MQSTTHVDAVSRRHAQREQITLGEAASRLAREGIRARTLPATMLDTPKIPFALLPARDEIITSEHACDLMDEWCAC